MSPPEPDLVVVAGACSDQIMVGRTGFSINRFDYGISEERGRRKTMEDHTVVIQDLGQCYTEAHLCSSARGACTWIASLTRRDAWWM